LGERRLLLTTMLDGVYVDTIEKKGVVSFQPKTPFKALFDIALEPDGRREALLESNVAQKYFEVPISSS
jgi:hypothetical protein